MSFRAGLSYLIGEPKLLIIGASHLPRREQDNEHYVKLMFHLGSTVLSSISVTDSDIPHVTCHLRAK